MYRLTERTISSAFLVYWHIRTELVVNESKLRLLEASIMLLAPSGFHLIGFALFLCQLSGTWYWHLSTLDKISIFLEESLNAATE